MWPELVPTFSTGAEEVCNALYEHVICRIGVPVAIVSDRGSAFMSSLMQAMCKLVGAKTYHCSSLKPTANSRSENMNFQIAKILKATLTEQEDWAEMLPSVCLSLRATPSTAHGFSSSYLLYGFDLRLPVNMTLINEVNTSADVDSYLREFIPKL
jgi:hypothetical protein